MTVEVTQSDIDHGRSFAGVRCALALAIRRVLNAHEVRVTVRREEKLRIFVLFPVEDRQNVYEESEVMLADDIRDMLTVLTWRIAQQKTVDPFAFEIGSLQPPETEEDRNASLFQPTVQ